MNFCQDISYTVPDTFVLCHLGFEFGAGVVLDIGGNFSFPYIQLSYSIL
jgi:hypothetical protein